LERLPRKRCRILPAEGLGVYPQTKKSPKIGGLRGLITVYPALYIGDNYRDANDALDKKDFVQFGKLNIAI
jgi:hypothetical protein